MLKDLIIYFATERELIHQPLCLAEWLYESHTGTDGVRANHFVYDGLDPANRTGQALIAKVDKISGELVYFTRELGMAPGVGDVLAETHILGASTQSFFYITNHRGDTVALVNEAGDVVGTYAYDAWCNITSHTGADAYFTFSSKHYDEDAGLYYYGFRWYDPVSKRWTQPDPEGLSEGLDLYQFCGNDPINSVDVYGAWICAADIGHAWLGLLEQAKNLATVSTGVAWFDNAVNTLNYSYIDLALTFFDLFGITSIAEAGFRVDRVTGQRLTWDERTVRLAGGLASLALWTSGIKAGVNAGKIGFLRAAQTGRLWYPRITDNAGQIFQLEHMITDTAVNRGVFERVARDIETTRARTFMARRGLPRQGPTVDKYGLS